MWVGVRFLARPGRGFEIFPCRKDAFLFANAWLSVFILVLAMVNGIHFELHLLLHLELAWLKTRLGKRDLHPILAGRNRQLSASDVTDLEPGRVDRGYRVVADLTVEVEVSGCEAKGV